MKDLKEDELQCGCDHAACDWRFDFDVITLALAQSPKTSLAEVRALAVEGFVDAVAKDGSFEWSTALRGLCEKYKESLKC